MTYTKVYRKRPVEIEAVQISNVNDAAFIASWITNNGSKCMFNQAIFNNGGGLLIDTLEGSMIARQGDYVVKGVEGEFYPVREDIFYKTYEEV